MFSTTLRIEESLIERIAKLAGALNQTPHAFMVEALTRKVDEAECLLPIECLRQD